MSFEKFKTKSFCFGGRHKSATVSTEGDLTKIGKSFLFGKCDQCYKKELMIVSDNATSDKEIGRFFKNVRNALKSM